MAVPVTDWLAPLALNVTSSGQTATLASASLQVKWTVTGPAYQPLEFGLVVVAPLIVGGVLSSLTVTESVPRLPAKSSASPFTTLAEVSTFTTVSGVIVLGSTPDPASSSLAMKWTVVSALFQSAAFADGMSVCVTIGAMLSYASAELPVGSMLPALSTA